MDCADYTLAQAQRQRFFRMLPADAIAVIGSAPLQIRSRDLEHPYQQNSDFWFLSGMIEPKALLFLYWEAGQPCSVLFCQPRDPSMERWEGRRLGPVAAVEALGVTHAFAGEELEMRLPALLQGRARIWRAQHTELPLSEAQQTCCEPLEPHLHELRLFKQPDEIRWLREAARISVTAHRRAMQRCHPGWWEFQLAAELAYAYSLEGARRVAYEPIVAGGANACTLHYIANDQPLQDGDLVLVDAACQYHGYNADITRTYPVNGRFSDAQRAIYELVLEAQAAAMAAVRPGNACHQPHEASVACITRGLVRLGLLSGDPELLIAEQAYRRFYMHRVNHWLGLDVHDVGEYRQQEQWRALQPGMVLTIEPGIYIDADDLSVDPCWRGIGVRIEDNLLVTAQGYELLTEGLPRTVAEIEALMAQRVRDE